MRCGHPSLSRPTCPRLPSKPAACLPGWLPGRSVPSTLRFVLLCPLARSLLPIAYVYRWFYRRRSSAAPAPLLRRFVPSASRIVDDDADNGRTLRIEASTLIPSDDQGEKRAERCWRAVQSRFRRAERFSNEPAVQWTELSNLIESRSR